MSGVIADLPPDSDAHTRLRELGFVPGTPVRLVRRAPMGDPIEVAVRGSRLAMRKGEGGSGAVGRVRGLGYGWLGGGLRETCTQHRRPLLLRRRSRP